MKTSAPLKKSQFGLYVECAQHPGEAYYNIPYLYTFDGSLDEDRLKTAIETAVNAHPALLTRIGVDEHGDPIQTVDDSEKITLGEVEQVTDIRAAIEGFIHQGCHRRLYPAVRHLQRPFLPHADVARR